MTEFETFRELGDYEKNNMTQNEPSCFNSHVRIYKYRITCEKVNEPKGVIEQRLQDLWDKCDNHHHWNPLKNAAAEIGYELKGSYGSKRKNKSPL